jgi:acetyl-CoA carboxylase biotin carboxylase subunit
MREINVPSATPATREIRKLLVANRGEIAVRIFRTCAKMGIATVAVFSDADEDAYFVRCADEAVRIGPAPSRESYLRGDKVIDAAKLTGADAIHPGFGFLAENAEFAEAVAAAGLLFVGPSPHAIRAMGLKREAKITAVAAGVPVVPGYTGEDQSNDAITKACATIGYPLLLKASAGGGGKGMRIVREDAELVPAIESARREAESAFGNATLIVEKYVERPRHIEIQILGDTQGNVVHLFERECSIQRRHQKIVEEAPSPRLSADVRARMGADAVKLAKSIGYANAGTVEFVVAPDGAYFFLEVNTRLQVEHPVTEGVIAGLDLVEEQLRVARGEPLRFDQAALETRWGGASIECRVCAEKPREGYLPQSGRIVDFHVDASISGEDWLRIETAIESGDSVPVHYDSMIAKIITRGETRTDAIQRMRRALAALSVHGIETNVELLQAVLAHPDFVAGDFDTHFLERNADVLLADAGASLAWAAIAAALHGEAIRSAARMVTPHVPSGFRNNRFAPERVSFACGERAVEVGYVAEPGGFFRVTVTGGDMLFDRVRRVAVEDARVVLEGSDGKRFSARVVTDEARVFVRIGGASLTLIEQPRFPDRDAESAVDGCVAPMPGKILKVLVEAGATVTAGQTLVLMEAMKMEHAVKAPHDGIAKEVRARVGEQVDGGALLVIVE